MTDSQILDFVVSHRILIMCWLLFFSINAMPTPTKESGAFYTWTFNVLHVLTAAVMRIGRIRMALSAFWDKLVGNGHS